MNQEGVGGVKPRVAQSAFDDLLGGFNPTSRSVRNIILVRKLFIVQPLQH